MTGPHRQHAAARGRLAPLASLLVAVALTSCTGIEDKRLRELMVEKGFGTRADGEATVENYVSGGDLIAFTVSPQVYLQPGAEQLLLLNQPQSVRIDGTIFVPYVGPVPVLGLTERELSDLVETLLYPDKIKIPIEIPARIVNTPLGKAFYVFGEAGPRRVPLMKADLTLFEALASINITPLANVGRIHLIKPDAQNPFHTVINFREMVMTGFTTYNLPIQENDIIYVPPTFFGQITRFVEKLLTPLAVIVQALLGYTTAELTYNYLFNDEPLPYARRGFRF